MAWLEQDRQYWRQRRLAYYGYIFAPIFLALACLGTGYEIGQYFSPESGEITCSATGRLSIKNVTFNTNAYKQDDSDDLIDLGRAIQSAVCKRNFVHS